MPVVARIGFANGTIETAMPPTTEFVALSEEDRRLILRNRALNTLRVPYFDPLTAHASPFSIQITDDAGEVVINHEAVDMLAFFTTDWDNIHGADEAGMLVDIHPDRFRRPDFTISSGETGAFFADLSPWTDHMEPGSYSFVVRMFMYHPFASNQFWSWDSTAMTIEVSSLDKDDRRILSEVIPLWKAGISAKLWIGQAINWELLYPVLPKDVWSRIAFHVLVGHAASAATTRDITPALVEALPDHIRPVADILRYELILETGDDNAAKELYDRFTESNPELIWMMDRAADGDGLIVQARSIRAQSDSAAPAETRKPGGNQGQSSVSDAKTGGCPYFPTQ
jgi:hypothetical protein